MISIPNTVIKLPTNSFSNRERLVELFSWFVFLMAILSLYLNLANGNLSRDHLYNSDALYIPYFFRDLIIEGNSYAAWKLQPAPSFFPDMFIYFPLSLIFHNFHIAISLYSLSQIILFTTGLLYLSHAITNAKKSLVNSIILINMSIFLYITQEKIIPMVVLLCGHHFGVMISLIFSVGLIIKILKEEGKNYHYIALALIIVLTTVSDLLFIAQFTIPTTLLLFIFYILNLIALKIFLILAPLMALSTIGGIALNKVLILYPVVGNYIHFLSGSEQAFKELIGFFTDLNQFAFLKLYSAVFLFINFLLTLIILKSIIQVTKFRFFGISSGK